MAIGIEQIKSEDTWQINGKRFTSRLLVGTGKYSSNELMAQCLEASGTQIVTVALRRIPLDKKDEKNLLDFIDLKKYTILPNTAGCYSTEEAIRVAHLARASGISDFVKLEVLFDEKTLLPDPIATLEATQILVKEGFTVMTYTSDDPVMAQKLEQVGAHAVMPAGSPIGSGQGVLNPNNIRIILEKVKCPVLIDAGVGCASDVAQSMELGVVAILLNTGIAHAKGSAQNGLCHEIRLRSRPTFLFRQAAYPRNSTPKLQPLRRISELISKPENLGSMKPKND